MHCFLLLQKSCADVFATIKLECLAYLFVFAMTQHFFAIRRKYFHIREKIATHDATCEKKLRSGFMFRTMIGRNIFLKEFFSTCDFAYTEEKCYTRNIFGTLIKRAGSVHLSESDGSGGS